MVKNNNITIALIAQKVDYIQSDVAQIKASLTSNYVTREEFDPIKKIVYGLITLVLAGLVGAFLRLVLIK